MTEIEYESLRNEIDFLQREVDRYREQNKKLIGLIIRLRKDGTGKTERRGLRDSEGARMA